MPRRGYHLPLISITLDTEWVPDPVLEDALVLLDRYGVTATLFSTYPPDGFDTAHERALHPNFGDDATHTFGQLAEAYPDATGLRSHRMHISTPLRERFVEYGIEYESNYMAYRVDGIEPFGMPEGTVQFPVYWMDDIWFRHEGDRLNPATLVAGDGLKVFDFHPPHVYFNTPSAAYYQRHKSRMWEDPPVERLRHDGYGVRDAFLDLLEYVDDHGIETHTLGELAGAR